MLLNKHLNNFYIVGSLILYNNTHKTEFSYNVVIFTPHLFDVWRSVRPLGDTASNVEHEWAKTVRVATVKRIVLQGKPYICFQF